MMTIWHDVKHAARLYRRTPAASAVALLTIALGIGANTAIFGLADALLLRPLPVADPDHLVTLYHVDRDQPGNFSSFSQPDYLEIRDQVADELTIAAWSTIEVSLTGTEAESVQAQIVSGNYFDTLGLQPGPGRAFRPDDPPLVVVLSEALWRRRFGADPAVVGRTIGINGQPFTVVGVVGGGFRGLEISSSAALWVPLDSHRVAMPSFRAFGTELFSNRGTHWLELVGRRRDDTGLASLAASLRGVADRQSVAHPETNRDWSITLVPAADARLGPPADRPIVRVTTALLVAVVLVLAMACANVANLLLARAGARRREMGIRLAIGASRSRLARQLVTETVLLALVGGLLGVGLALLAVRLFALHEAASWVPGLEVRLDLRVLAFALGLSLVTGVLFGLAPAIQASAVRIVTALRGGEPAAHRSMWQSPLRHGLVVVQVAIGLVLLVGAGLALRTVRNLQSVPLGFDPDRLSVIRVDVGSLGHSEARGRIFFEQLTERMRAQPGVEAVGIAFAAPFGGRRAANDIFWDAPGGSGERRRTNVDLNFAGPGYFEAMGIPVKRGRAFTPEDATRQPGAAVVNAAMAAQLWPDQDPIGKRLWSWDPRGSHVPLEVVGVVADGRYYRSWRNAGRPFLFLPFPQWYQPEMAVHVRTAPGTSLRESDVRATVAAVDASVTSFDVQAVNQAMSASIAVERASAELVGGFGLLALVIAVIGVYGVVSFTVAARTREIGVRLALGAGKARVLREVLGRTSLPVLAGIGIGSLGALGLTRLAGRLLFGVSPQDPWTFAAASGLLLAAGLMAGTLPARRAARIDPLAVLKQE